jgi:Flp pilus assembly protein TadD
MLVEALAGRRKKLGPDHPDTLISLNDLALLRQNQKRFDEAEALFREAMEGYRRVLGPDHPFTLAALSNMGTFLVKRQKPADAEPLLREALDRSRRDPAAGANNPRTLMFQGNLGMALAAQNKFADAETQLLEAIDGFAAAQGAAPSRRQRCIQELVKLYLAWDKAEPNKGYDVKAREWQAKLPASRPATTSTSGK